MTKQGAIQSSGKGKKLTPAEKRRGWFKFLRFLILLVLAILIAGFLIFAYTVDHMKLPSPVPKADGIVVLTGKGGNRLAAAAELLKQKKGERLLISGVNRNTPLKDIQELVDLSDALALCCLDLDYAAEDTIGNARETASWAEALGYEHIILVTSAYHMPRAEIEIGAAAGRIKITPYPVSNANTPDWWADGDRFKGLAQEYAKLLLSYIREPSTRDHRNPPPLDLQVEPPSETPEAGDER